MTQPSDITRLRESIEEAVGRKILKPRDFDFLSERIFEQLHESISPTTLKRAWGYLHDTDSQISSTTLNILARFLGHSDFKAFTTASEPSHPSPVTPGPSPTQPSAKKPFFTRRSLPFILLGLLLLIALPFAIRGLRTQESNMLRRGTRFASYEEYFKLFGIEPDPYIAYYTQHPEYPYIYFWAPEYEHPVWHNEGNPDSLMPTITTYYHPDDLPNDSASLAQVAIRNKRRYISYISECPVLLTFMKNLHDSTYVFLGAYCFSAESDTARQVWKRVQDDVDINNLKALERYHN